jgi:hypothetical protein
VPRALKKIEGGGVMDESLEDHVVLSASVTGWSLRSVVAGARREMEWMEEIEGRERRVERMWEPWCFVSCVFTRL